MRKRYGYCTFAQTVLVFWGYSHTSRYRKLLFLVVAALILEVISGAERVIIKVPTLIDLYKDDACSHDQMNVESEAVIRKELKSFAHKNKSPYHDFCFPAPFTKFRDPDGCAQL